MLTQQQKARFYVDGEKSEHRFGKYVVEHYGGSVEYHNGSRKDRVDGIDITWTKDNGSKVTFQIKSKQPARDLLIPCEWVELKNIYGGDGWLYKKAQFVVFEYETHWLSIYRETLVKIVEEFTKGHSEGGKAEIGSLYRRKENKDLLTRIPIAVIEQFSTKLRK